MANAFEDHFASVASQYAASRPTYPAALFAWLATQCPRQSRAWDCGAGNGQATIGLAQHFDEVIATDASAAQLAEAPPHPRATYRVAPAEASGIEAGTVDLVTVAQALHWFDQARFAQEVRRVAAPGAVIAVWSYGVLQVEGDAPDRAVQQFYHDRLGAYWPAERRHVENGYRDLPFPFEPMPSPSFEMTANWGIDQLTGYLRSWSATARYIAAHGDDPVTELEHRLSALWDASHSRQIRWPLMLRVGRI